MSKTLLQRPWQRPPASVLTAPSADPVIVVRYVTPFLSFLFFYYFSRSSPYPTFSNFRPDQNYSGNEAAYFFLFLGKNKFVFSRVTCNLTTQTDPYLATQPIRHSTAFEKCKKIRKQNKKKLWDKTGQQFFIRTSKTHPPFRAGRLLMAFVWLHRVQWVRLWSNRSCRCYFTKKENSIINWCSKFDCKYLWRGIGSKKISIKAKVHIPWDGGRPKTKENRSLLSISVEKKGRKPGPYLPLWFFPLVKQFPLVDVKRDFWMLTSASF